VTTTTTTKRTFPPVFVRESRRLESLDAKEYPLALKPTPPELAKFSYDVAGFQDIEDAVLPKPVGRNIPVIMTSPAANSGSNPRPSIKLPSVRQSSI
jgi:hypothetical protein